MEQQYESTEWLEGAKSIASNGSWLRDTPHFWAEASLPLAYAVACVEVVCKSSQEAGKLYDRIGNALSDRRLHAVSQKI